MAKNQRISWVLSLGLLASMLVLVAPGAQAGTTRRDSITITNDSQFDAAHGVRAGSGTKADPFVISGWDLPTLRIADTDMFVRIEANKISRLVLNWNGDRLVVTGNTVGDLRVNENVPRTGDPTSGRIYGNRFNSVSQLRHFDGIFEKNVVGSAGSFSLPWFDRASVRFDGFNGARFRDNTIYGAVQVQLHGHHHSSSYEDTSHHHGAPSDPHDAHGSSEDVDHTTRYHQVSITGNKIYSYGSYALRYTDQAHSANDRTAKSEENQELNAPHVHHTKVQLSDNDLVGAGLYVDIFNAKDQRHRAMGEGELEIEGNTISVTRDTDDTLMTKHGISVRQAEGMHLMIVGNVVTRTLEGNASPLAKDFVGDAAISLTDLNAASVHLYDNSASRLPYGIFASRFSESVHWWVGGLTTEDVQRPLYYDQSVKNPPRKGG